MNNKYFSIDNKPVRVKNTQALSKSSFFKVVLLDLVQLQRLGLNLPAFLHIKPSQFVLLRLSSPRVPRTEWHLRDPISQKALKVFRPWLSVGPFRPHAACLAHTHGAARLNKLPLISRESRARLTDEAAARRAALCLSRARARLGLQRRRDDDREWMEGREHETSFFYRTSVLTASSRY